MSLQENKALVLRFVEEVQNKHNLTVLGELFSSDFIDHSGMANTPGLEGARVFFTTVFAAFPDSHLIIHQQLAEGDKVMTYKTFHGTHLGPFLGIPATGKQVAFDIIDIMTVTEGHIAEHWAVTDLFRLMQQIGVLPVVA